MSSMPGFSRQRFQRIKVGPNVTIEVLETGSTITKLEITAPQGWRILRGERKLWDKQTMFRDGDELERAAAKKLGIAPEELVERTHPDKLADIRDPDKLTKLIIERKQFESVKIGPYIYVQLLRASKTCRMGIERSHAAMEMEITQLDISDERRMTEMMRAREAAQRHARWVANGGPERLRAEREEQRKAA